MIAVEPPRSPRLLYLTVAGAGSGRSPLRLSSRINIGVLSRDFDVSVAVAGPLTTAALHRIRVDLGPTRVSGAFEASRADGRYDRGLRRFAEQQLGSDRVCARLQSVIRARAAEFDAIVVDHVLAMAYRPVPFRGPVGFVPDALNPAAPARRLFGGGRGGFGRQVPGSLEAEAAVACQHVYARPEIARALLAEGVPMKYLEASQRAPERPLPRPSQVMYARSQPRIGYSGYLGDRRNSASLHWFLDNIWSAADSQFPGVELHLVGGTAPEPLRARLARFPSVVLHPERSDQPLINARCRVVIEPLVFEDHVDAKLINAMARGIPVVTSLHALERAHTGLHAGITAADSRESMIAAIRQLMTDSVEWGRASRAALAMAAECLPDFEVAHLLRRALPRLAGFEHNPSTAQLLSGGA